MAITYRDKYGRNLGEIPGLPTEPSPYIVDDAGGGITYICYFPDDGSGVGVTRITQTSSGGSTITTIEHAFGALADRASLTYYPINQSIPVEEE